MKLLNSWRTRTSLLLVNSRFSSATSLTRNLHTSPSQDAAKKAVIFDMGGVILPSPFGVAYSMCFNCLIFTSRLIFHVLFFRMGITKQLCKGDNIFSHQVWWSQWGLGKIGERRTDPGRVL